MQLNQPPDTTTLTPLTPLMKQYWDIKNQVPDALLFFRMGDFYELFGDDAIEAARLLEITLTSREKNKPNPVPMAGVPHHSAQNYIQRLLKSGKKVAIGEQLDFPSEAQPGTEKTTSAKAIVRRELTRVFTPAVNFDLDLNETAYLATAIPLPGLKKGVKQWILACLDPATGESRLSEALSTETLSRLLDALPIKHLLQLGLAGPEENLHPLLSDYKRESVLFETLSANFISHEQASRLLREHYRLSTLSTLVSETPEAIQALAVLVQYVMRLQKQSEFSHLRLPAPLRASGSSHSGVMAYGPRTPEHLDLFESAHSSGGPTLFSFLNRTHCSLGARELRRWLAEPLANPVKIQARQASVQTLAKAGELESIRSALREVYDLERLSGRLSARLANPRDVLALGRSLERVPGLALQLNGFPELQSLKDVLASASVSLNKITIKILASLKEDAPLASREGGIFQKGVTPDLDRLISLSENGERWLVELETREREATGISSLKVRYNRVFGYYIEITSTHASKVPAHYQRKQTMVGAERFFTEELKKFEDDIVNASFRQRQLEEKLFEELLNEVRAQIPAILSAARAIGELDALTALALWAQEPGWIFPTIDDSLEMHIESGRHPIVEQSLAHARGSFIPNSLNLSPATRLQLLITGPNMGGKSTVMRQMALIVALGQMGAPVPAAQARWGTVSALHTRIGAHDAIARGQSTFMVEMSELAHILHHADSRALLILDEIGRGTSTYDGMSVAWAALEQICHKIQARTLFATHYHELTLLTLPGFANAHMAVADTSDEASGKKELRFLYELREGPANESYGVHVAELAGLPRSVTARAWEVLEQLEKKSTFSGESALRQTPIETQAQTPVKAQTEPSPPQLSLFSTGLKKEIDTMNTQAEELWMALQKLDLNRMTPLQTLNWISRWQQKKSNEAQSKFS